MDVEKWVAQHRYANRIVYVIKWKFQQWNDCIRYVISFVGNNNGTSVLHFLYNARFAVWRMCRDGKWRITAHKKKKAKELNSESNASQWTNYAVSKNQERKNVIFFFCIIFEVNAIIRAIFSIKNELKIYWFVHVLSSQGKLKPPKGPWKYKSENLDQKRTCNCFVKA